MSEISVYNLPVKQVLHARSKRIYLRVRNQQIIVTTSRTLSSNRLKEVLGEHEQWLHQQYIQQASNFSFPHEINLPASQENFTVGYEQHAGKLKLLPPVGNHLIFYGDLQYEKCISILKEFIKNKATQYFLPKLKHFSQIMALPYQAASIRGQRTRWGSCSSQGIICLNYKLLFFPEEIADYVIIHELSHLKHLDHSVAFWNLVRTYAPNYQAYRQELTAASKYVPRWIEN